ncbi:MAG: efflux RND transporter periplasmic adaptor subunit [Bauldia sp.]|nr:efflux RND transporter periplasmic adaptor subunit [Bauldia sp.]
MSAVKQLLLSFFIVVIAGAAWLAYTNRDLFLAAVGVTPAASPAAGQGGSGQAGGGANVAVAPPAQFNGPPGGGPVIVGPGGGGGFAGGGGGGFPGGGAPAAGGGQGGGRAVSVIADAVVMETIGDELRSLGSASAARAITIFPPASGLITAILVSPGAEVAEGEVILTLEDDDQEIAVERARLALDAANSALERAERLARSQNITEVALADARNAAARAEIDLRSAEVALARRSATAPFAGVVGLINVTVGDIVSPSTEITTLDDMSSLRVTFEAPARFAGRLRPGQPVIATSESVIEPMAGTVTAVNSRIDETTRTFRVEAGLDGGIEGLRPGMAVNVTISFPGEERPTVSSLAVLWDSQGSYVWKIDGNRARRTPVQIISRRSGTVVVAANLTGEDQVIIEGYQRLRDGATVAIATPPAAPTAAGAAPTSAAPVAAAPANAGARVAAAIPQEIAELIRAGSPLSAEAIAQLREGGQLPPPVIERLARGETLPPEMIQRLLQGAGGVANGAASPAAIP